MSSRETLSARRILIQFFTGGRCINLSNHLKFFKDRRIKSDAMSKANWNRTGNNRENVPESVCCDHIFYLLFLQARENEWLFTCYSTAATAVFCSSRAKALRTSYFICKISLWLNTSTSLKCIHLNPQHMCLCFVSKDINFSPSVYFKGRSLSSNKSTVLARHSYVLMKWKYPHSYTYS